VHEPPQILFVCLGNICRSPLAEAAFRLHLKALGGGKARHYQIASRATSGWNEGQGADGRTVRCALQAGLDLSQHRSRQIKAGELAEQDLIVVMDESNRAALHSLSANSSVRARIRLLREFDPELTPGSPAPPVPDPWSSSDLQVFQEVQSMILRSTLGLLQALESGRLKNGSADK
jgi:protein-tyrosine phosphatase